jgi:hypothetical protein
MFGNTARSLPRVHSYADAEKVFNQRGAVRSKKWAEHERPLYKTYYHYRVAKYDNHFDIILYSTVMARYYVPTLVDSKVHERRLYMGDNSITSKDFMHYVLGVSRVHELMMPDGKRIVAPIYHKSSLHHDGNSFSADYRYVDGVLDTDNSVHTRHFRKVSSKEDREHRARIVKVFEPYILLAQMRMPEFHNNSEVDYRAGRPFSGASELQFKQSVIDMAQGSTDQTAINHFFEMCQSAYEVLISKRAYAQSNFDMGSSYHKRPADSIDKIEKQITPSEFRTAIIGRINRMTGANDRTESVEIPQFVVESEYPRTNIVFG